MGSSCGNNHEQRNEAKKQTHTALARPRKSKASPETSLKIVQDYSGKLRVLRSAHRSICRDEQLAAA
jgi:hypothetical protein